MTRLILVAGHAIPYRFDQLDRDEGWHLKPFQSGEGSYYVEHVRRGVELAAVDASALLLFAGGQTDIAAGPRSEGQGYWLIASHLDWFGHGHVKARSNTEEFSLDSFQNLLYGLCRFREITGRYPERVTAVGWSFKGTRFHLHREAIRYPIENFEYEGVNDPPRLADGIQSEAERRDLFRRDPYGAGPESSGKREARNVFHRRHGYLTSCPEAAALLLHRGPELFEGPAPWSAKLS